MSSGNSTIDAISISSTASTSSGTSSSAITARRRRRRNLRDDFRQLRDLGIDRAGAVATHQRVGLLKELPRRGHR